MLTSIKKWFFKKPQVGQILEIVRQNDKKKRSFARVISNDQDQHGEFFIVIFFMENINNSIGKKKIYSKNTNLYRFYKINKNEQVRVPNLQDIRERIRMDNTESDTTQNYTSTSNSIDNQTNVHNFSRERPYPRNFNLEPKSYMAFIIFILIVCGAFAIYIMDSCSESRLRIGFDLNKQNITYIRLLENQTAIAQSKIKNCENYNETADKDSSIGLPAENFQFYTTFSEYVMSSAKLYIFYSLLKYCSSWVIV